MKKSTQTGILAVMGLAFVGAATFLFTRKAAAKEKAQEAFVVDQDCGSFLVVDEDKAKAAFIAAAIAVAPSPDSNALGALKAILAFMFPMCTWDDPPDNRTFVRGTGASIRWIDAKNLIGDKTVAELRTLLEDSGGLQASTPIPWIVPMVFGTGGCMSCAMGTGGQVGTGVAVYGQTYDGPHARYVNAYRAGTPVYSIDVLPTTWITATYLPVKPPGVHRRWIQLGIPIYSGSLYRNAILFTQWGAAQQHVYALVRTGSNGKVSTPLQAKVMPEGWIPPAAPPGTGGCGMTTGLPGTGGPQHLRRRR